MAESEVLNRGAVREIMMVVQYPDHTIKIARYNPENIARIVLDHEECEKLVGSAVWEHEEWQQNPTLVLVMKDGEHVFARPSCSSSQHPPGTAGH